MNLRVLSQEDIFSEKPRWRFEPESPDYFAMYSSLWGGAVKDPALMVVPLDDHMVHRGDGIFEACKCVNGYVHNFDAHLSRLENSARLISLDLPFNLETIKEIALKTVAVGGAKDCIMRIYVSRGLGGGFTCHPINCRSQLYVVVAKESAHSRYYTEGASAITSSIPIKPSFFAQVKSCNYLPNALAHLEAYKKGADFAIMVDQRGCFAEGPTESIAIVDQQNIFKYPKLDNILRGTTILRVVALAEELIKAGELRSISSDDVFREEAHSSLEMFVFGSGIGVVPIVKYDEKIIGTGKPGPIFYHLSELIQRDWTENFGVLTPVPYDKVD
jgi:branched-subunit amino acid aminotransferase/4-amino-4-deoxychorismate lyase